MDKKLATTAEPKGEIGMREHFARLGSGGGGGGGADGAEAITAGGSDDENESGDD